jgi:hypothetical protein
MRRSLLVVPMILLSACALQEAPAPTLPPPLTLAAPPPIILEGNCDNNQNLADWLQFSTYYVGEFTGLVTLTATKDPSEMYDDVVMMSRIQDVVGRTPAPDCAEAAHRILMRAIEQAITDFQAIANHEKAGLGNIVAETLGQFDQVAVVQEELTQRLETQLAESMPVEDSGE